MKGIKLTVTDDGDYIAMPFDGTFADIQDHVGGLVECVPSEPEVTFWVNEEGNPDFLDLPLNRLAMDCLIRWDRYGVLFAGDGLYGNVVITGGRDDEGNTLNLSDEARAWVMRIVADARLF